MNTPTLRNLVVAYTATDTGRDALNLGIAMARTSGAHLNLVTVVPQDNIYAAVYPSDRGHMPIIQEQVREWLEQAQASLPSDISSSIHTITDSSDAAGLLTATQQLNGSAIVLGGRRGGLLRRFRLGTTATTLLHSSPVPVALAPGGYQNQAKLSGFTAMFGARPGAEAVIHYALQAAQSFSLPLRLVSLLFLDEHQADFLPEGINTADLIAQVEQFGNEQLAAQAADMVANHQASTVVATGKDVHDAVDQLTWMEQELVIFGSSRLASEQHTFLGATAAKILRHIPSPMMVIPAETT